MAKKLRVALEIGPRGKKVAVWAPGWPGLERGASTSEEAIERLVDYLPRYKKVAKLAGLDAEFATIPATLDVGLTDIFAQLASDVGLSI